MKIQNLALIFIVIMLPILLILGYYLKLQEDTLELQSTYDAKLSASVKEGIRAYEVNTVNWRESNEERRRNVSASMNTFLSSLANNMGISGTAREYMSNYVPAVAMTMYDGYYIYAPAYVAETIENNQGVQLYFDGTNLTTSPTRTISDGIIMNDIAYKPSNSAINVKTAWSTYEDEDGNEVREQSYRFTTDAAQAEKTYKHSLSNEIAYSGTYQKGNVEVTINYTLDNRIYVYGKDGSKDIKEQGCLVAFTAGDANSLPKIKLPADPKKDTDIQVIKKINEAEYMGSNINSEILTEQILYKESEASEEKLGTFKYIYDVTGKKLYYDEDREEFFTVSKTDKKRNYLPGSNTIKVGDTACSYKSVSVLVEQNGELTYKKIYQVLNGRDKGNWYIGLKEDPKKISEVGPDKQIIDTEIKGDKRKEFEFTAIYRDYSAVSYYVEAYAFTNWIGKRLGGEVTQTRVKFNEETKKYESERVVIKTETREGRQKGIFEIDAENDMEKENSLIVEHKREIMIDSINSNLNLSISNYSRNSPNDYRLPVLQASDWDQIFKNISMIAFFQGVPIGLKTYNNYAITTSTQNRDYVDPDEIFFSSNATNYHRAYCTKLKLEDIEEMYRGYRSVEYTLRTYEKEEGNIYYYQHTKQSVTSKNSDLACYSCIINKENYERIDEKGTLTGDLKTIRDIQAKAYKEALARERYYQNEEVVGNVGIMIRYHENVPAKYQAAGIVKSVDNMPEDQEALPEVKIQISTLIPTITTNDIFIQLKCSGWSTDPNSDVADYIQGESYIFKESVDLYAIWSVSLSNLHWNDDFYWNYPKEVWPGDGMNGYTSSEYINGGTVSNIRKRDDLGGSVVEMVGNSEQKGKGATWTTFESDYLKITKFAFDYSVNAGHSFNAAGFIFNVTETPSTLEGLMISINFAGKFRSMAGGSNGAIYKFTYNKNMNQNQVESIALIRSLNIGGYGGSYSGGSGNLAIEVLDNGYKVSGNEIADTIITLDEMKGYGINEMKPDTFGFFSDHFGSEQGHTCHNIGFFQMKNIKVSVDFK